MNAVCGVNAEHRLSPRHVDLINTCRTIKRRGFTISGQVAGDRYLKITQLQVNGLIFIVRQIRQIDRGRPIKAELAVGRRSVALAAALGSQAGIVGLGVREVAQQ